jgi:CHAD domain-containing protein
MASLPQNLALHVQRAFKSPNPDQVHNLRVAIRRFNQAAALNSPNRNKAGHRQSKEIMKRAGDVRNLDITLKLVAKLKGTKALQAKLRRRRAAGAKRLATELKAAIHQGVPDQPAVTGSRSRQAAAHAINRLFKRGANAKKPKDLHRVRIAVKKLRYTLEMVAPGHPRLDEIKRLQSDLGRINDFETAWKLVGEETGEKSVRDQLKDKQRKKIHAFHARWTKVLADPHAARAWIGEIELPEERDSSPSRD